MILYMNLMVKRQEQVAPTRPARRQSKAALTRAMIQLKYGYSYPPGKIAEAFCSAPN